MSVTSLTVSGVAPFWAILEIHLYSVASVSMPRESWTSVKLACTPTGSGFGLPWSSHTLNSWACRDMPGVPLWWNIPIESSPSAWIFQYLTGSVFWSDISCCSPCSQRGRMGLLGDFRAAATRELAQAEDHELGRLHRGDADLADDLPGLDHVGRVGLGVALDEEGLLRGRAEQRARPPCPGQEAGRRVAQLQPQELVVGLEHAPLRAFHDRLGDVVEQPAHVDVAPLRVAREGPGAPHADAAAGERADAVDADLVEAALLRVRDLERESVGAHDDLVGRGLVDAAALVDAAPESGDVARRRDLDGPAGERVHRLDPRVVQRRHLRVVAGGVHPPLEDLLREQVRRRIQDRHPVAHVLAVGDHLALQVADLRVVRDRPEVGHDHDRDLVDRAEAAHAEATRLVALEVAGLDVRRVRGRRRQRVLAGGGDLLRLRQRRARVLDADQLRGGVDLGGDVRAALLEVQALELLLLRAGLHDQLVGLIAFAGLRLLGQFDLDRALGRGERLGAERLAPPVRGGRQSGLRARARAAVLADAHDPAVAAAVREEAVHGVGHVGALHEGAVVRVVRIAEDLRELGPVRDPHRRVDRTAGGEPHERSDRGTDALDGLVRGGDLLDVDAWRQVRGHVAPYLGVLRLVAISIRRPSDASTATRRAVAEPGSSTSSASSPLSQRITFVSGETDCTRPPSSRAPSVVRSRTTMSGRVSPAALAIFAGWRSWPITSAPPSAKRRAMPMTMIGARFPKSTRGASSLSTLRRSPITGTAR